MSFFYDLKFNTGVEIGSGTDENVLVRLYGYDGKKDGDFYCDYAGPKTNTLEVKSPYNDHEARGLGGRIKYKCTTNDFLGKITKLVVYVNPYTNNPDAPAWFLDSVEVSAAMGATSESIETWIFPCKEWIGIPERCPGQVVHRFVELTENGSKVFDHDPEGDKAELNYPIKTVSAIRGLSPAIYNTNTDPYWSENVRVIIE